MIFNLIPIPPLDGSKILAAFLPAKARQKYLSLERYGFIFILLFIMLAGDLIVPAVEFLYKIIVVF
jgi:Zn-dependent protease